MDKLSALLFELSSDERMHMLLDLCDNRARLSHIAQKQDITVAEGSRHLQRLSEAELVSKDTDGLYLPTSYGKLVLSLLSGLKFVTENRHYFLEHDISGLPIQFLDRIGELGISTFRGDTISNLAYEENMFKEAEEFCWGVADQVHWSARPIVAEQIKKGVRFRSVFPENIVPPEGYQPVIGVERRFIPKVDVIVVLTDKEAVFGLPFLNGKMDYAQFASKDPVFRKWCIDLFFYYWDKSKALIGPFPNLV